MYLTLKANGAKDWASNLGISLASIGNRHKLQFHHIFPKAILKTKYRSGEINDIANMAFISGKTNRRISAKPPEVYIANHVSEHGKEAFESQCIPCQPAELGVDDYLEFLAVRRRLLAEKINEFLHQA